MSVVNLQPFNIIAKPIGPVCNLNCSYCFYLEKEKLFSQNEDFRMADDVLEAYIKQTIKSQNAPIVDFIWQGGEPTLLGVDYFRKVVEIQKKYAHGKDIRNAFQTNGVLLDDEWCEFFKENKFLVGISIDGPEDIHNRYRLTKNDKGAFSLVMRGMECLKKHNIDFNTLTSVQRENAYKALEVYHFLKKEGSNFMQFIPIVERVSDRPLKSGLKLLPSFADVSAPVTDWSVEPKQYGIFLSEIFDEWVRNDVGRIYVQIFDVALETWFGMEPSLCIFRKTCGQALAIEHNGDVYSCDHYVFPENRLGNILETPLEKLVYSGKQIQFGKEKETTLPQYCRECPFLFVCNGGCPKDRFITTPDGEEGLNYLCEGYQYFFAHVDPYMRFMANELRHQRPPANVMSWAREKDLGFPSLKVKPNDRCPCGSGKKYKYCCGQNLKH